MSRPEQQRRYAGRSAKQRPPVQDVIDELTRLVLHGIIGLPVTTTP